MSFTLTFGQEGNCATAQVVWSVNGETYNFRSDNNFVSWISTIFTVADVVAGGGGVTNPLVLPNNTNANGWSLNTLDNGGVGGSITMIGSTDGSNSSNSGNIDLSAGNPDGSPGGSIDLSGGASSSSPGGSINLSSQGGSINTYSQGGSINTYSEGGSINTYSQGGSINTTNGGGSIDTKGGTGNSNGGSINTYGGNESGGDGGSINTYGGSDSGGDGGSINTSGYGDDDSLIGGSINTSAGADGPGGSINTSNNGGGISTNGNGNFSGGNINTSASGDASGGFIDTSADSGGGGYINTSNGGGSIDTTGNGSIGFGTSGIRTTLVGSAVEDRTITMPDATGTMAVILVGSATIDFANIPANSTLSSDVSVAGVLAGDAVLVTCTDVRTGADQRVVFTGFIASTLDTVTVLASNTSTAGINLPSLTFKIIVFKGF